jgi:hypothetical protein
VPALDQTVVNSFCRELNFGEMDFVQIYTGVFTNIHILKTATIKHTKRLTAVYSFIWSGESFGGASTPFPQEKKR